MVQKDNIKMGGNMVSEKTNDVEINLGKIFPIGVGLIVFFWLALSVIAIVDSGTVGVQKTFGSVSDIPLDEGLHFKAPWTEVIKMSYQTERFDADATAASNDLQDVRSTVTVNYHLNKESAVAIYRERGLDYANKLIPQAVQGSVKATTAKFTAEQLITNRASVRSGIEAQLKQELLAYGITVEKVEITNFNFSESFNAAIEAKVTAEQKALEAQNFLKQVEFEAQQKVATAKGEADSVRLSADASAYSTLEVAKAQAEALRIQNEALSQSQDVLELRLIEKWDGHYPTYYWVGSEGSALIQVPNIGD